MITISLCMIVKNEETVLARCLESVKGIPEEIIIVDTGSTDNTQEIARRYTEKVYEFPWIDDFAAARNFSFSKATQDYIFWLDADDVILPKAKEAFLQLKKTLSAVIDMVMLPYHTAFDENGNVVYEYYRERLLRREKGFLWQGVVHEAIPPEGNIVYGTAAVSHKKEGISDPDRNLRIFEKLRAEGKTLEPRQTFYYARELYYHQKYEKAIEQFTAFLEDGKGWIENNISACLDLYQCYRAIGEETKAFDTLCHSFLYDTPRGEICCMLGYFFFEKMEYKKAIFWYELATKQQPNIASGGFVSLDCYGYIPYLQLCVCYDKLGDVAVAAAYNQKAKECKPEDTVVLQNEAYFREKGVLEV